MTQKSLELEDEAQGGGVGAKQASFVAKIVSKPGFDDRLERNATFCPYLFALFCPLFVTFFQHRVLVTD
jgi:hypothetical protein